LELFYLTIYILHTMSDGNMLLQGVVDANDRIRAENAANYQKYQQTKEIQAGKEKGEEYY